MKYPLVSSLALLLSLSLTSQAKEQKYLQRAKISPSDSPEQIIEKAANVIPSKRQMAYHAEEFIGFIHFGINTFTGKEWGNGYENPKMFNPEGKVDTDQWCKVMKAAGMTKVIITIKHHDGFCTWQTKYNDAFSLKASPWKDGKGDVLRLLAKSARKYGLKLGVYLSPADLYQINQKDGLYGNLSKYQDTIIPTDPASFKSNPMKARKVKKGWPKFKVKADDYNRYFMNQLYELLTEYGEIHECWFDGAHPKRKGGQTYIRDEWIHMIRTLAPKAVIFGGPDVRWCGNEHGGTRANEWNIITMQDDIESWRDRVAQDIATDSEIIKPTYHVYGQEFKSKLLNYSISEVDTSVRNGWFWRNDTEQKVKSADWAFDVYERSVGGNAVFLLNVPPNKYGKFSDRDVKMMLETGRRIRKTYGKGRDLAKGATVSVDNLRDSKISTFWQADAKTGEFTVTLPKARKINRFSIQEAISKVGQRVKSHALDAWVDGSWKEISKEGVIGYKRTHRFSDIKTDKFRVRILDSRANPAIAEISAHYYDAPPAPVFIKRNAEGKIELYAKTTGHHSHIVKSAKIYYTLDGSKPTKKSKRYTQALNLPKGGNLQAVVIKNNSPGPITKTLIGLSPKNWSVSTDSHHAGYEAEKAFDGDSTTHWHTSWAKPTKDHQHNLTIDLKKLTSIGGFAYLPRQDRRVPDGMVEAWKVEASRDGKTWKTIQKGEFGNLLNDPSERPVYFKKNINIRYFRFVSLRGAQNKPYAAAAEFTILPARRK